MTDKLCKDVEIAINRTIKTPKDFDYLRECIFNRLRIFMSSTTLKRLWGYLESNTVPRESTLSTLARFLGYDDWDDYKEKNANGGGPQSNPVLNRRISVPEELVPGAKLRLTWLPNRILDVVYAGDLQFNVLYSENTRIQAGDIFSCSLIIEGAPMYLDNLCQDGKPSIAYVCGKRSGVRFEELHETDK